MKKYSVLRFPGFKEKAVTLSYDDSPIYDRKLIEIMDKNGLKGTFNINSGRFVNPGERYLTKEEALELYKDSGHEVAVHGRNHLYLPDIDTAMVVDDIINDRIALEEMFGGVITGMAYAYGAYNDSVVDVLKMCGIEYARTTKATECFDIPTDWLRLPATCHHNNPRLMELAREFAEAENDRTSWVRRRPKLFYLWGHSYEYNDNDNWEIIEEFAEYIGGRDDIWYATNIEICRYVKAFDMLKFAAHGKMVYNPTATDLYISYFGNDVFVPAGATVELKTDY